MLWLVFAGASPSRTKTGTKPHHNNAWFTIASFSCLIVVDPATLNSSSRLDKRLEFIHVSSLDINRTRTRETAYKTLARLQPSHRPSTCLLDLVVTTPCHEVTIVYNVLFPRSELLPISSVS
jgi:hypothetical protein